MLSTLAAFAASKTVVVVTKTNGKAYTGTLVPVGPAEPNTFSVRTGRSGRPAKVHADDVEKVETAPQIAA